MAAKRTADLIPLCHPLALSGIEVAVTPTPDGSGLTVTASVRTTGPDGGRDGSADRGVGGAADDLRHAQGGRQGDGHRRGARGREARRALGEFARHELAERRGSARGDAGARSPLGERALSRCVEANGRILREDVRAPTRPAAVRRLGDGRLGGARGGPAGRRCASSAKAPPGTAGAARSARGEAVRISTGAALPEGADWVVIQEEAVRDGDRVRVGAARRQRASSGRAGRLRARRHAARRGHAARPVADRAGGQRRARDGRGQHAAARRDRRDRRRTGRAGHRAGRVADPRFGRARAWPPGSRRAAARSTVLDAAARRPRRGQRGAARASRATCW